MAPQVGLEPTTLRLTAGCSAIELLRSVAGTFLEGSEIIVNHNNIAILPWEIQGAGLDREDLVSKRNCQFLLKELATDHR